MSSAGTALLVGWKTWVIQSWAMTVCGTAARSVMTRYCWMSLMSLRAWFSWTSMPVRRMILRE